MTTRVLVVALNFAPELTGIGKYVADMTEWLDERGCEVEVIAAPPYYPGWRVGAGYSARRWTRERLAGATVTRCPLYVPARPSGARRLLHLLSFALTSAPVILARCLAWRPHVVLVVEPPLACAPVALLGARLAGATAWLHVQDFEVDAAFELGLLRAPRLRRIAESAERGLMRAFDRVSTISDRMLEKLAAKGVPEQRRRLFPNWVDVERIQPGSRLAPLRAELGVAPDDVLVAYSGNFGEKQGVDLLVQAAHELRGVANLRFLFCGEGAQFARIASACSDLPNVRCAPLQPLERLGELMSIADVHVLPQRADVEDLVMPSKLVTMMASGRPVVATARPGSDVSRAAAHGGIVTPPGDVRAFCEAVLALARDEVRRQRLGTEGRRFAVARWSRAEVLQRAFVEYVVPAATEAPLPVPETPAAASASRAEPAHAPARVAVG